MNDQNLVSVTPYFGGFILETLTIGMYGESRNAIREYIQNAFDSIQTAEKRKILPAGKGEIRITLFADRTGMTFRDNGAGIPAKNAIETLTNVGASKKDPATSAGFRGIGRLAAIGFCTTLTFKTRAKGEDIQSVVRFHGAMMREMMSPQQGGLHSAEQVLKACIEAWHEPAPAKSASHFFEVTIEGFDDAPIECVNEEKLYEFVSQIAPVDYSPDFEFRSEIQELADECGLLIDITNVVLVDGESPDGKEKPGKPVYKPYVKTFRVGEQDVELSEIGIGVSPDKNWFYWVGKKTLSGSYDDERVRGIRVRMKNIQIDTADVIGQIFRKRAKSSTRFQDWYVGEVFVKPNFVVPNARRDDFEETPAWTAMRDALDPIVKGLTSGAQLVSSKGQLLPETVVKKVATYRAEFDRLKRAGFDNQEKVIALSANLTAEIGKIAKATVKAGPRSVSQFNAIASELKTMQATAISKLVGSGSRLDADANEVEVRNELLNELLSAFEEELLTPCFVAVRKILKQRFGVDS